MFKMLRNRITPMPFDASKHRYPKEYGYIYSVAAFREVMEREYARSNRNKHGFSFVVLHIPQGEENKSSASAIIELVGDRLRVTDHAGWLRQDRCLGVLLYACKIEAAEGFVERLCNDGGFDDLKYTIYSYPDDFAEDILKPLMEGADE